MTCIALGFAGLLLMASCGAEAPTFEPPEPPEPGNIFVRSTPPGAAILIDGAETGLVTPDTLIGLDPGLYQVTVEMVDFVSEPDVVPVDLEPSATFTADFTLSQTGFQVTSPAGARILVDGTDTGKIVPAAVAGLDPGTVKVSLEWDGYLVAPAWFDVTVTDKEITEIPDGTFSARWKKTVILEGFANTSCAPCPQLTDNLLAMVAKPEFSSDRVQFLEFSVSWPQFTDPFYQANPQENGDRISHYAVLEAPDLYIDGVKLANPLDAVAMENAVLAALETDPGFLVEVSADFSSATVPVTVTLIPDRDLDLTDHVLFVAVIEKELVVEPAPGLNEQTHFHHIFRDRVDSPPNLGPLTAGTPQQHQVTLLRGDAGPDSYIAVAFVQHASSRIVLEGGSTATSTLERNFR